MSYGSGGIQRKNSRQATKNRSRQRKRNRRNRLRKNKVK